MNEQETKPMSIEEACDLVKQLRDKATIQGSCATFKAIDHAVDLVTTMAMGMAKHKCKPGPCQCDTTPDKEPIDAHASSPDPDPDPDEPAGPGVADPVQSTA